jgi:hypothetical protein
VATRSIKPGSSPSAIPLARADAIASKFGVPASYDIDDFLFARTSTFSCEREGRLGTPLRLDLRRRLLI